MRVEEILKWLDSQDYSYTFAGKRDVELNGFSSLVNYVENTITWIKNEESYHEANRGDAVACAVVKKGVKTDYPAVIETENPKEVFFAILRHFWGEKRIEGSVGEGTVLSKEAVIEPTVTIGCNCSIIGDVVIGANTVIEHNVVIQGRVRIGENCYIQSGAVIGIAGFGFSKDPETKRRTRVEHFGGVEIGDDVFIASHVNIERGTIDNTVIGNGVKIAPSTLIAHNNVIGEDTIIISSALYGSVKVGARSYIAASTIENQKVIGNDTVIGMGSVVHTSIGDNVIAYGTPARVVRENDSDL